MFASPLCSCRVGLLLLKGEWKEAVRLIMQPHEGERDDNDRARKAFLDEGDISGALKLMQRHLTAERSILEVSSFAKSTLSSLQALCILGFKITTFSRSPTHAGCNLRFWLSSCCTDGGENGTSAQERGVVANSPSTPVLCMLRG